MSEAEPNQNPSQDPLRQTRPSDASFFVGREGLRLPGALLKLPDSSLPVQPVTDLFDTVSHVWDLNGYQTGRQPRYEVIELPPRGYNLHALLFSSYIGKSDEELANVEPLLDRSGTRLRQTQHGETIQGVENFAISIPPDIARTGKSPKMSSGRVSILLSRIYHFASELVQDLHPTGDGAKPAIETQPNPTKDTTFAFMGTHRVEQLEEAQLQAHEYTTWAAHYFVSELLADHSR